MTSLAAARTLGDAGFFVFPCRALDKRPLHDGWQAEATRTPETWPDGANIGIFCEKFGDDQALVAVDVDTKGKHDGEAGLFALEIEGFDLPTTFEQTTPSGGRHLIFIAPRAVAPSVSKIAPGIDIRSAGSYILGPGSALENGPYTPANRVRPAMAPTWLIERAGAPSVRAAKQATPNRANAKRALNRATDYLLTAPTSLEGEGGDITAFRVVAKLKDFGVDRSVALGLMSFWNQRCSPPWTIDELSIKVDNAFAYGTDAPGSAAPEAVFTAVATAQPEGPAGVLHPFIELNKQFAFVLAGGGSHILWETTDADGTPTLEHLGEDAFHKKHASKYFGGGDRPQPLTKAWMGSSERRSFDGLAFAPGRDCDPRYYNLWRGFAYAPASAAEHPAVELWIEHARTNVCGGDGALFGWLVGFFAHLVQQPQAKPLVSLVFKGGKGVGKNALVERVGALLGSHFLVTANRRYLTGNFNGHLERCLMLALDEAFWSGDKQTEGIVKDLITGSHHVIEHKGKEPYRIRNLTRIVVIGNEDWIVPASNDERRFAVFNVGDGRKQDRDFFETMRVGMEQGGYPHLLRYLLDFPASDVNNAPVTVGLNEQKEASLDLFDEWWLDSLKAGVVLGATFGDVWPTEIPKQALQAAFRRYTKDRSTIARLLSANAFGRRLHKVAPSIDGEGKTKAATGGAWSSAYKGMDIERCRAEWDAHMGFKGDWS